MRPRDPYLNSGEHFLVRKYIRQSFAQWGYQIYPDLIKAFYSDRSNLIALVGNSITDLKVD